MRGTAPVSFALAVGLGATACAPPPTPIRTPQPLRTQPTSCISALSDDTTVYDIRQIDEKAVFRKAMKLTYPPEALREHIGGRVVVTAIVNRQGDVDPSSVTVVQHAHPLLDAEARRVVSSATLWPACRDGHPVRMRIAVPFDFEARGPAIKFWQAFAVGLAGGIFGMVLGHAK